MDSRLFRQSALDRLASPERLDQLPAVTSRRSWISLLALLVLIVAGLAWSIFGSLPSRVSGPGIFVREGGNRHVAALGEGALHSLHVRAGDVVAEGDLVAVLEIPDLALRVEHTRTRLRELEAEQAAANAADKSNLDLVLATMDEQRTTLLGAAKDFDGQVAALAEQVATQETLQQSGLIPRSTFLSTQAALANARQNAANARVELAGNTARRSETLATYRERGEERLSRIAEVRRELVEIEARHLRSTRLRSPFAGRVVQVEAGVGDLVTVGLPVVTLENADRPLEVVLFIPAAEGKRITPGMEAQLSPSTVRREEHGFIRGSVAEVSLFPVSDQAAGLLLRNQRLVEQLFSQGNPIAVRAVLQAAPDTPGGFVWSGSRGPAEVITSGTLADGQIVVRRQRPITLVIPFLRSLLGLD